MVVRPDRARLDLSRSGGITRLFMRLTQRDGDMIFHVSKKEQKKKSGMTHELERVARISFHKGEEARSVESSTDTDRAETVFVWEEEKNGLAVINDSIV